MDKVDLNCLNCSSEKKAPKAVQRGRRFGTIDRKPEDESKFLDEQGRPVTAQARVIKIPRQGTKSGDEASPKARRVETKSRSYHGSPKESVSSAQMGDFSVQVFSVDSPPKKVDAIPPGVFSRASMMSSSPYRDNRRLQSVNFVGQEDPGATPIKTSPKNSNKTPAESPGNSDKLSLDSSGKNGVSPDSSKSPSSESTGSDHSAGAKPATPPRRSKKRVNFDRPSSLSLPGRLRLSHSKSTPSPPLQPLHMQGAYAMELPYQESVFYFPSPTSPMLTGVPDEGSLSPTSPTSPLSPKRKRVVQKLMAKHLKRRKDFAQLYISSMQERRGRRPSDYMSWEQGSSSSRESLHSEVLSAGPWLQETEQLISASNETLSREDYFKILFFEKSLRRKRQSQESLAQSGSEVHISAPFSNQWWGCRNCLLKRFFVETVFQVWFSVRNDAIFTEFRLSLMLRFVFSGTDSLPAAGRRKNTSRRR